MKGLDLISGKTATKFAPAENMNRAEFLVLAMRVYHHMTGTATPTAQVLTTKFADKLPTWAEMTISEAADLGFVSGTEKDGKTYFNPSAQITTCLRQLQSFITCSLGCWSRRWNQGKT